MFIIFGKLSKFEIVNLNEISPELQNPIFSFEPKKKKKHSNKIDTRKNYSFIHKSFGKSHNNNNNIPNTLPLPPKQHKKKLP